MTPDSSYKECEACGNVLVQGHRKYCSDCWHAIKDKEKSDEKLLKRIEALEKRIERLTKK